MRAFVKTNNGTFPNLNFYLAWEAFNTMGYFVTLFEEHEIPNLPVTPETPVFAGVKIFRQIIDKLGVNYSPFDCYPSILNPYYGRTLVKSTLGVEKEKFHKDHVPVFVKPVLPKQFIGNVWSSILNLIPIAKIPDDAEVWVCEPLTILSEFRVYVHDGEILGVKHYYGEWDIVPDKGFIKQTINSYKPCPIAYGIDIGVSTTSWGDYKNNFIIEVNDGCNLGNYGLDAIHFGEMIVSRWFEIMSEHKVDKEIRSKIDYFSNTKYADEYTQEKFEKPDADFKFSRKELMLKSQLKVAREESMKSFAEDVMKRLKEEK